MNIQNKKKLWIPLVIIAAVMAVVVACLGFSGLLNPENPGEESYRNIQVYKIVGTAMAERAGIGEMPAYENMKLQSGDKLITGKDSSLYLRLDEDKYVMLEPESEIHIEAHGSSTDSKTYIRLERGAIVNRLDNPLNDDSVYEINTPNATMAVRGTVFRVVVTFGPSTISDVYVYGGMVLSSGKLSDNSDPKPELLAEKGEHVQIGPDETGADTPQKLGNIDYTTTDANVLAFLREAQKNGAALNITPEELEKIIESQKWMPASCGSDGHYAGDGKSHAQASCGTAGHYVCDGQNHTAADCGTTGHCNCDGSSHAQASCGTSGHYACDGKNHTAADCGTTGHCNCDSKSHTQASCGTAGHYECDGKNHTAADCGTAGHWNCDSSSHAQASCGAAGHYVCDGKNHTAADCGTTGHSNCDGKSHIQASCGTAGHYVCDGKNHTAADCGTTGHWNCDGNSHAKASCGTAGHYVCDGKNHTMLTYTMEYYLQDLNGNTYTKHTVTTNGSAEINTVLAFGKSDAISINGFTFIENAAENVLSATLTQDGFVFKFYYSRNKYTLTVDFGGEQIKAMKEVNYERVLSNRNEEYGQQSFTVPYGADIASYLPAMTFTDIGYKFTGWSQSSGTMPAGNLTVKAQWTPVQVTVVFSPGASYLFPGGYDSAANTVRKTYDYGSKISWPADVVIRNEGYVIAGWSFGTQQGSYPVLEFPVYLVEGYVDTHMTFTGTTGGLELTVCPYWAPTSSAVTVVFDANGGKGTMDSIYVDAQSYRELPQMGFTRSGYRFTGWNTAADGSGTSHDTTFYPDYGSGGTTVTLYAQWEAA